MENFVDDFAELDLLLFVVTIDQFGDILDAGILSEEEISKVLEVVVEVVDVVCLFAPTDIREPFLDLIPVLR